MVIADHTVPDAAKGSEEDYSRRPGSAHQAGFGRGAFQDGLDLPVGEFLRAAQSASKTPEPRYLLKKQI